MAEAGLEAEELGLIYGNSFVPRAPNVLEISILVREKTAIVTFTLPPTYPDELPQITAEIAGITGRQLEEFLQEQAQTMTGIAMISYLVGEARDFLSGAHGKALFEQHEHISQTPFSRDRFLLWLDGFNSERELARGKVSKPLTGRQMFEQELVKPNT
jgi:hypothetical protein